MDKLEERNRNFMNTSTSVLKYHRENFAVSLRKSKRQLQYVLKREIFLDNLQEIIYYQELAGLLSYPDWKLGKILVEGDSYLKLISTLYDNPSSSIKECILLLLFKFLKNSHKIENGALLSIAHAIDYTIKLSTCFADLCLQILSITSTHSPVIVWELDINEFIFLNITNPYALDILINFSYEELSLGEEADSRILDLLYSVICSKEKLTASKALIFVGNMCSSPLNFIDCLIKHKILQEIIENIDDCSLVVRQECSYIFYAIARFCSESQARLLVSSKLLQKISKVLMMEGNVIHLNYLNFCFDMAEKNIEISEIRSSIEGLCYRKNKDLCQIAEVILDVIN